MLKLPTQTSKLDPLPALLLAALQFRRPAGVSQSQAGGGHYHKSNNIGNVRNLIVFIVYTLKQVLKQFLITIYKSRMIIEVCLGIFNTNLWIMQLSLKLAT